MLTITDKGQTQWLLKTLLSALQSHVLIAENLRQEGAKVSAFHKSIVFSAQFLFQVLILTLKIIELGLKHHYPSLIINKLSNIFRRIIYFGIFSSKRCNCPRLLTLRYSIWWAGFISLEKALIWHIINYNISSSLCWACPSFCIHLNTIYFFLWYIGESLVKPFENLLFLIALVPFRVFIPIIESLQDLIAWHLHVKTRVLIIPSKLGKARLICQQLLLERKSL